MMSLRFLHLVSAYTLWCLGTYALWLGEADSARPYPILVVLSAVIAIVVTDTTRWICMPGWFSNALGLLILVKIAWDLSGLPQDALLALAHFLVYLQVAKWFREKRIADFGLLYIMNILQLAIGAILAKTTFGTAVMIYFLLAIWCGMLFFLACHLGEIDGRGRQAPAQHVRVGLRWIGAFALRSLAIWIVGIPLALLVFWLLPRPSREDQLTRVERTRQQWTGFTESVTLEKETNLVDTGEIAFHVWARDYLGNGVELPSDMLWRGSICMRYEKGKWRRGLGNVEVDYDRLRPKDNIDAGEVSLDIERVASTGSILFSPAGAVAGDIARPGAVLRHIGCEDRVILDEGLSMPGGRSNRLMYQLVVDQSAWDSKYTSDRPTEQYLRIARQAPRDLERVRQLAEQLTSGLDPADIDGRIQRLFDHLTATGGFSYAMATANSGSGLDPIEDFLFVKKAGHCEFFAGSMALLLRYAGVPSRFVVGFKGLEMNRTGGFYSVRQMLAHAWVEAYDERTKRWITIDPTPGEARENAVVRSRGWFDDIIDAKDAVVRLWQYYVVSFTFEDQRRFVERLVEWAAIYFGAPAIAWEASLRKQWGSNPVLVVLIGLCTIGGGAALLVALRHFARRVMRGIARHFRHVAVEPYRIIYEDYLEILARIGLKPRFGQTPLEFAEIAQARLAADPKTAGLVRLPLEMTNCLYRCRFGGESFSTGQQESVRQELQTLAKHI